MANQDQTSQTSSSPSTAHRELSPMEDPRSPFFLHHGESPGAILVTQPLTEDNYPKWARAMRMALDAKSKLGFVDGTITASMAITPLEKIAWSKNNSMISSWILNSVSSHISGSVIYRNTAMEVWNSLKNRFLQVNGPRISQLQKQISTIMQGDATVTSFFTDLQASWDQLLNLRPLPCCSYVKTQGFNQGGKNTKGKGRPICSHCGKAGHFMEKCYKLIGFPPGYKQKGKVSMANQVSLNGDSSQSEVASQPSSFPFTSRTMPPVAIFVELSCIFFGHPRCHSLSKFSTISISCASFQIQLVLV
ncbi:uncharacterized protein LOC142634902 [Castanea sativa]|uniref:uncharacterized protein LOC142634902 n=1 Tax=Castanea sativa TaxID=21020 RepID=UPI003F652087